VLAERFHQFSIICVRDSQSWLDQAEFILTDSTQDLPPIIKKPLILSIVKIVAVTERDGFSGMAFLSSVVRRDRNV
jgi:hypothetical protein